MWEKRVNTLRLSGIVTGHLPCKGEVSSDDGILISTGRASFETRRGTPCSYALLALNSHQFINKRQTRSRMLAIKPPSLISPSSLISHYNEPPQTDSGIVKCFPRYSQELQPARIADIKQSRISWTMQTKTALRPRDLRSYPSGDWWPANYWIGT